jgi:DNA-binding LacI/PurR family transcriptional regulator
MMTTIKDVAQKAGVSLATVSRVLNGHPYVADDVRSRVLDAIEALNYRPSRVAQRLRAPQSRLIGVIFSDIKNPFYTLALTGMEQVLSEQGLSLLIGNANSNRDREDNILALMKAEDVAGLVIAPVCEDSAVLAEIVQSGLPVVVIDRNLSSLAVDTVLADNRMGAYTAIRHLVQLGHQRIAIVNGPQHLTSGRERYAGFLQAMEEAALIVDPELVRYGDYQLESGYRLTRELLALPEWPTALFIANNLMTIGALNAIHEANGKIPDDIAVIGFDDLPWAISLNPPLTTVAQPTFEIGVRAAELLLDHIANPDRSAHLVILDTQLIVRASCSSIPARRNETR